MKNNRSLWTTIWSVNKMDLKFTSSLFWNEGCGNKITHVEEYTCSFFTKCQINCYISLLWWTAVFNENLSNCCFKLKTTPPYRWNPAYFQFGCAKAKMSYLITLPLQNRKLDSSTDTTSAPSSAINHPLCRHYQHTISRQQRPPLVVSSVKLRKLSWQQTQYDHTNTHMRTHTSVYVVYKQLAKLLTEIVGDIALLCWGVLRIWISIATKCCTYTNTQIKLLDAVSLLNSSNHSTANVSVCVWFEYLCWVVVAILLGRLKMCCIATSKYFERHVAVYLRPCWPVHATEKRSTVRAAHSTVNSRQSAVATVKASHSNIFHSFNCQSVCYCSDWRTVWRSVGGLLTPHSLSYALLFPHTHTTSEGWKGVPTIVGICVHVCIFSCVSVGVCMNIPYKTPFLFHAYNVSPHCHIWVFVEVWRLKWKIPFAFACKKFQKLLSLKCGNYVRAFQTSATAASLFTSPAFFVYSFLFHSFFLAFPQFDLVCTGWLNILPLFIAVTHF